MEKDDVKAKGGAHPRDPHEEEQPVAAPHQPPTNEEVAAAARQALEHDRSHRERGESENYD